MPGSNCPNWAKKALAMTLGRVADFFGDHRFEMLQRLGYGQRIHFLSDTVARFERRFQKMSCNFDSQWVGNHLSGTIFVLDPCRMRKANPNCSPIDQEFDIDGIGMSRCDGNNQCLIDAMDCFLGPAVGGTKI